MHHIRTLIQTTVSYDTLNQIKDFIPTVVRFIKERPLRHWMIPSILFIYWKLVVYLHEKLDAGPFVLIMTVLVIIFTVGLGDHGDDKENMSAYSVFNRGFRSILGGVDANALLNQHVGGGFLAGVNVPRDDVDIDENVRPRGRQAMVRQEQQQQQELPQAQQQQQQQQNNTIEKSRKSNKKNRRKKNIEQRREIQRQREAAMAMGFVGDGGNGEDDWQNHRDQMAMNRLVEDEIRQAVAMQHGP